MHLLIDTSSKNGSMGLCLKSELLCSRSWTTSQNHTSELLPTLDSMITEAKIKLSDISAIGVTKGPGGFSAVRAGIVSVQGLAFGLAKPVVAVNALEVIGLSASGLSDSVCALIDAGKNQVIYSTFFKGKIVKKSELGMLDEIITNVPEGTIFVSAATISDSEIVAASGFESLITNYEARLTEMGKLVEKKIALGEVSEPGDLIPEYARDPNIGRIGKK